MPPTARPEQSGLVVFARHVLRAVVLTILRLLYRIQIIDRHRLPVEGAALLVSNHVSYIDAILIGASTGGRWVRFVIFREFLEKRIIGPFVRLFDVVPVSSTRARDAMRSTIEALRAGHLVCIFPEGQLTRHGAINPLRKGFELIARGAAAPVVAVWLDNVWGSIFSFERGRFFRKRPRRVPYRVSVSFGIPIPADLATADRVRCALDDLACDALARRIELCSSLDFELAAALRRSPGRPCLIDGAHTWSRGEVLALASVLAAQWRHLPDRAVPVSLPFGIPAVIANLALVLAGRVPVNGPARGGIDEASWHAALGSLPPSRIAWRRLAAGWPVDWCRQRIAAGGPVVGIGEVYFTHRSLLAHVQQLAATNVATDRECIVTGLSPATVAGSLLGCWYPLLRGIPLSFGAIPPGFSGGAILGLPLSAPGFISLQPGVNFLALDHIPALVSISQKDPERSTATAERQLGGKPGTLGRILPGWAARFDAEGRLSLRGPGIPGHEETPLPTDFFGGIDSDGMLVPADRLTTGPSCDPLPS